MDIKVEIFQALESLEMIKKFKGVRKSAKNP